MAAVHQPLQTSETSMILVMGVTGSGKSHFINTLVEGATKEYSGLRSGTKSCQMIQTKIGEDTSVAIVDTPGFDDTNRPDAEVFSLITEFLMSQYQLGIPLKGIIYLHRIIDPRMQGSALRNFQMFQKICGEEALKNVILLTTMWDKLKVEMDGLDRDQELREDFWSLMEERGSYIARFDGSWQMAESLVARLLAKDSIILNIQRELHDEGKRLDETSAGRLLAPDVDARIDSSRQHIDYLNTRIRGLERDKKEQEKLEKQKKQYQQQQRRELEQRERLRARVAQETQEKIRKEKKGFSLKDGLSIFAVITGVAVNVVFHLLPLFGVYI